MSDSEAQGTDDSAPIPLPRDVIGIEFVGEAPGNTVVVGRLHGLMAQLVRETLAARGVDPLSDEGLETSLLFLWMQKHSGPIATWKGNTILAYMGWRRDLLARVGRTLKERDARWRQEQRQKDNPHLK
jgi:hypothetical protein